MNTSLSASVRQNLTAMQSTAKMLSLTQTRLATGKKVNSALDNPSSFFQARSMNNRASQLSGLLDSMSNAQSTIKAADNALSAITDLVGQARSVAQQALQADSADVTVTAQNDYAANASAGTLSVTVAGGTAETVTVAANATASDIVQSLNAVDGVTAKFENNKISVTAANGESLTVSGNRGGFSNTAANNTTTREAPDATRTALAKQFNELRTQINEIAKDAGFNGTNLLQGDDLDVIFNEKTSSSGNRTSLDVNGVATNVDSLGVSAIDAFDAATAPGGDFQTDSAINAALGQLSGALDSLESTAASFGSDLAVIQIREDFTKSMISTLEGGAADLTLADANEEGAKMLALQTRQELASTALALSVQADQSVLRLF